MLRRFLALLAVLLLVGATPAMALDVRYNNNVTLSAGIAYPTASFSSTYTPATLYCVSSPQFENSIFNPGGPLLTPILNNWLYWGNAFNWTGNNCKTSYNYVPSRISTAYTPVNLSSGDGWNANYARTTTTQNGWEANYANTSTKANQWNANYTPTQRALDWDANYTPTTTSKQWNANYSPTVTTKNWNANYTPTERVLNWNANYAPTERVLNWNANYTPTERQLSWNANYSTTQRDIQWDANYTAAPARQNGWTANYGSAGSSTASRIVYPTGGVQSNSGAAFGSLFGDGRDPAFQGSAVDSFVARLRGQTTSGYTARAEDLSNMNYSSFYDVNPVTTYTPVSAYDRSFTVSPTSNLNAVPTTGPATSGAAVQDASRNLSINTPLQQNTPYAQDLQVMESRGLLPATWKNRAATTTLNREELARMLVLLRNWRDTGMGNQKVGYANALLPVITDMKPSEELYFAFVFLANERVLYMSEMRENNGVIVSAKAEPKNNPSRAQTLQSIMTALYLRPNSQYSIAGYTDLTADKWYTQWALTARAYGLDFGSRFDADRTVTQQEAAHMVATMLKQIR